MSTPRHCYPKAYQDWLFQALGMESGDEITPVFLEPLYTLNRAWVNGEALPDYSADADVMRAYTCYYMTINMPKLWAILDRSQAALDRFLAQDELQVTEFGCGPGTFLWAFLFYLRVRRPDAFKRPIRLTGFDSSSTALKYANSVAEVLLKQPGFDRHQVEFINEDWRQNCARPGQFVIFGNVLNEGVAEPLSSLDASLALVIEPGTTRCFHEHVKPVRDQLMEHDWSIEFPCTSHHACPMAKTNWCHFHVNRFVLPFIQRMSGKAKRLNPRHNFCGFLFAREGSPSRPEQWRVLSKLRRVHRSGIRWICDGENLVEAVLNRQAKSETNRPFMDADVGDAIEIRFEKGKGALLNQKRIKAGDQVRRTDETGA